jgi:methionyl-tRNA formyltransferase
LLPERRGREPLFFAMLAGKEAGVSVHWMTPKLDNGPVVVQQPLATTGQRTLHQLILAACELAAQVVPLAIDRAIAGRPPRRRRHAIAPHGRLAFARRRRTIQVKGASVRVTQSGGQARNDCGQRGRVCPVRAID